MSVRADVGSQERAGSPGPVTHVRLARPCVDLPAVERFYTAGLGLSVLLRVSPPEVPPPGLAMLGWPGAAWHLELVGYGTPPQPTVDDLLVLYLGDAVPAELLDRLVAAGGRRVTAHDPYWEEWGVTVEDPDGYRLVLSTRRWPE
ncbi:VOC family protein [Actinomycetospora sp. TBRC 11914]|uniref:VOC family protein n=1 Tax=Actinomycetospora sp. TBRC 11914 TaxID=2729387 RepID=UPI00145CB480|nr:VOC family protein [Actinomycetospora sp. TBRC 11914]NMO92313.1 VOC family protein [Actinomycetospora sp. TBRC 11914]